MTSLSGIWTLESLTDESPQAIRDWLMSLAPDSPASPSATPESDSERTMNVICGPQQSNVSAWYDRDTHCWRTYQDSFLLDTLEPFSETWPKAGMMHAGVFYPQPKWERPIKEPDSGLLPSPTVEDAGRQGDAMLWEEYATGGRTTGYRLRNFVQMWRTPAAQEPGINPERLVPIEGGEMGGMNRHFDKYTGRMAQIGLTQQVQLREMWPTPMSQNWRSGKTVADYGNARPLQEVVGGQLNPTWVEWLMGWPLGWTDLKPLETDKFRQWWRLFGGCFPPNTASSLTWLGTGQTEDTHAQASLLAEAIHAPATQLKHGR